MTLFPAFSRASRAGSSAKSRTRSRDANVAVIMLVMMSLVFAPIIAIHLVATFAPASLASTLLSRSADTTVPPG
ncbi:hypothetical protein [Methylobacterium sp. Leaf466]|uniref:hypothetical protein n=1 Tax=Methylobacterium sp. Leaf466 TaxID=1736386 RepID=UPI00070014CD|nr:hypothetical protein [Methylobacterium sp. Leaf466]KQT88862.1 hypothetical protein ASG59_14880 [Methylobacterium sp. Leaf466]